MNDAEVDPTTRVLATGGLMLAVIMQALDSTIANVALPHMMGSLSAAQDQITWVLTSYIVAAAIMTPFSGWLALKIGRKPMFLFSIVAFVLASVLCGVATNLPEMVFFRLLQGFAGAGMMPLSQAAIFDLWPAEVMPRVMSIWSATIMVGPILGPTLGGYLTEHFSWRWVFYINVPVGALAFALVYFALPANEGGRQRPFDFIGFGALVLFTGCIQLMADRGPSLDWFYAREIWIEAILALCGLYVFVVQTLTAEHPFFPREVLRDRNFVTCTIMIFAMAVLLYSTNALMPSFMQNLMGYSALQSGEVSMYRGFGSMAAFALVPWMARVFRPRPTVTLGVLISGYGLWLMAHFDLSMTAANIKAAGVLQGFGMGLMANPLAVLSYATISAAHRTEAAVFSTVVRTMGASLGIAGLQAMLTQQSAAAHERLAANIIESDPVVRWSLPQVFGGAHGLDGLNAEITRQGSVMAYDAIFAWMALASLLLVPMLLILRPARAEDLVQEVVEA
ncbi:DHA2 family efflux MFS transporter permease subunit [Phenylobacterium sp. LjRoot219]|uniref:DHA2 family efflux MFS transporter permease subunit n=1 Tax=Phenylobacterium sp. LjRoot219 TaxID=3342283 RepID=UPI003ED11587